MLDVIHIYPKQFSFISNLQNKELLLYHFAKEDSDYIDFYKRNKNYKIMDNSQYELRKEVNYDDLIEVSKEIKINEIVLPDSLQNGKVTRELVKNNLNEYYEVYKKNNWKTAAVVQGENIQEINETLEMYMKEKRINVIMIPRKLMKNNTFYLGRLEFLSNTSFNFNKPIHLLGANSWGEFHYPSFNELRSLDTKLLIKTVLNEFGKTKWNKWNDVLLDEEQMKTAKELTNVIQKTVIKNYYGDV